MPESVVVEIRPLASEELGLIERHIDFDWGSRTKHHERLTRQHQGKIIYLVAWYQDIPVGHVLVDWDGSTDEPMWSQLADCPNIEDLFVVPRYRSRRIGSRLLEEVEALAYQKGYSHLGLGVAVDNPCARHLYERHGYKDAGYGEYTSSGRYVDWNGQEQVWAEICHYLIKQIQRNTST